MYEFIARIVSFFYSITSSYGLSILLLTLLVMLAVMPLTFKSTKSMIEMRRIQPQIKKIQTRYSSDREKMNKELMALYQRHGVNPVGGCLPMLVQAPVFFVLFRVVRGLTRRTVDTGYAAGNLLTKAGLAETDRVTEIQVSLDKARTPNFNPEYLKPESEMYRDLINSNEMLSWGIDLSRSASDVIRESIGKSIPFMVLVVITGILSWYQQHQVQGRATGEMNPQMKAMIRIIPWMAPLFAFTLPAALGVYFIGSALFRVMQNAIITGRFYGSEDDTIDEDLDDDGWEPPAGTDTDAAPAPFGGLFGGGAKPDATPANRHGSRRPVSTTAKKPVPPKAKGASGTAPAVKKPAAKKPAASGASPAKGSKSSPGSGATPARARPPHTEASATPEAPAEGGSLWSRAKRSAAVGREETRARKANGARSKTPEVVQKKTSKRVTPKGGASGSAKKKK